MGKKIRIVLFGPRNVGKTNVGIYLSRKLGINYIDLDNILTERFGSIEDIVDRHGWEHFRKIEFETLKEILSRSHDESTIIILGGGTISHEFVKYRDGNINILNKFQPTEKIMLIPYNDLTRNATILTERTYKITRPKDRKPPLTSLSPQKETSHILKTREKHYKDFASYILYTEELREYEIADKIIEVFNLSS
jgi:shikimate kinase